MKDKEKIEEMEQSNNRSRSKYIYKDKNVML